MRRGTFGIGMALGRALTLVLGSALVLPSLAAPARAEGARVVELFTSQGCSSCPPADAMLADLVRDPSVIALALHVDYWDYIGWKDTFASAHYSDRQYAYARAVGETMVYTPQVIVGGSRRLAGHSPGEVAQALAELGPERAVALRLARVGDDLAIRAAPLQGASPADAPLLVQLVRYLPEARVEIGAGENAGSAITYVNVVTSWERLQDWDATGAYETLVPMKGKDPAVVIVQEPGPGAILAAYRVE